MGKWCHKQAKAATKTEFKDWGQRQGDRFPWVGLLIQFFYELFVSANLVVFKYVTDLFLAEFDSTCQGNGGEDERTVGGYERNCDLAGKPLVLLSPMELCTRMGFVQSAFVLIMLVLYKCGKLNRTIRLLAALLWTIFAIIRTVNVYQLARGYMDYFYDASPTKYYVIGEDFNQVWHYIALGLLAAVRLLPPLIQVICTMLNLKPLGDGINTAVPYGCSLGFLVIGYLWGNINITGDGWPIGAIYAGFHSAASIILLAKSASDQHSSWRNSCPSAAEELVPKAIQVAIKGYPTKAFNLLAGPFLNTFLMLKALVCLGCNQLAMGPRLVKTELWLHRKLYGGGGVSAMHHRWEAVLATRFMGKVLRFLKESAKRRSAASRANKSRDSNLEAGRDSDLDSEAGRDSDLENGRNSENSSDSDTASAAKAASDITLIDYLEGKPGKPPKNAGKRLSRAILSMSDEFASYQLIDVQRITARTIVVGVGITNVMIGIFAFFGKLLRPVQLVCKLLEKKEQAVEAVETGADKLGAKSSVMAYFGCICSAFAMWFGLMIQLAFDICIIGTSIRNLKFVPGIPRFPSFDADWLDQLNVPIVSGLSKFLLGFVDLNVLGFLGGLMEKLLNVDIMGSSIQLTLCPLGAPMPTVIFALLVGILVLIMIEHNALLYMTYIPPIVIENTPLPRSLRAFLLTVFNRAKVQQALLQLIVLGVSFTSSLLMTGVGAQACETPFAITAAAIAIWTPPLILLFMIVATIFGGRFNEIVERLMTTKFNSPNVFVVLFGFFCGEVAQSFANIVTVSLGIWTPGVMDDW